MRRWIVVVGLLACDGPSSTSADVTGATDGTVTADGVNTGDDGVDALPEAEVSAEVTPEVAEETGPTRRTGLEGNCDRYVECGGSYYDSAQACIDASLNYWTECRRPELDAFGECMAGLSCDEWGDPDAYNPANTPCVDAWQDLNEADCP